MTSLIVKTRLSEHQKAIRLFQPEKLAVAQRAIQEGYNIHFGPWQEHQATTI